MNIQSPSHKHYAGIQKSFEKAFSSYDEEALVQQQAAELLIDSFDEYKSSHHKALDLGCGTGLITKSLCEKLFIDCLHINDISPLLLKTTCERLLPTQTKPLLFNFDQRWRCKGLYNLIFSNMAFSGALIFISFLKIASITLIEMES